MGRKMFRTVLLILVVVQTSKSMDRRKVPIIMYGDIYPTVIECKMPIYAIFNADESEMFTFISPVGTIHYGELDETNVTYKTIDPRFELPCKEYMQSSDKKILFGYGGRDFHAVDIEEKISKRLNVSFETNERILAANMIGNQSKNIMICVSIDGWGREDSFCYYLVYNIKQNGIINRSKNYYGGILFYVNEKEMLFQEWNIYPKPLMWSVTNELFEERSNELTKKLTEMNLSVQNNAIDLGNRKLIGYFNNQKKETVFCYIRWKENFEDPSAYPFTFQKPKDRFLQYKYEFSPDGKWVKGTSESSGREDNTWIMFYHCDDAYPGGLSIPVHGGDSHTDSKGVFLETKEYGTVYLDISQGMNGVIFMYKMSDVLEQIGQRAKEMVE